MPAPIRYTTDLESPKPDEDVIQAGMIEQFANIQGITLKDYGRAVRGWRVPYSATPQMLAVAPASPMPTKK